MFTTDDVRAAGREWTAAGVRRHFTGNFRRSAHRCRHRSRLAQVWPSASAYLVGGGISLATQLLIVPISTTPAWMTIAKWVESPAG